MLTIEDIKAHERMIAALPSMELDEIVLAYRDARRLYEARLWTGEDLDEPQIRSELLAHALVDRQDIVP